MNGKDSQLDKLSMKELKDLEARIDKLIAEKHVDERNQLREKFRAMAEQAGFSLVDLTGGGNGSGKRGKRAAAGAKFASHDDPSLTWSGRGRMPNWLSQKVKAGASVEDFRIAH